MGSSLAYITICLYVSLSACISVSLYLFIYVQSFTLISVDQSAWPVIVHKNRVIYEVDSRYVGINKSTNILLSPKLIIFTYCNYVQCMRPQAMGSNTLNGSKNVHLSIRLSTGLLRFYVCLSVLRGPFWTRIKASRHWTPTIEINTNAFPAWGSSVVMHFPHTGVRRTAVGSSSAYVSVCLYVCISVYMYVCLYVCM